MARSRALASLFVVVGVTTAMLGPSRPGGAQGSTVSGGAFGHYTRVSLFGGPSIPKGPTPDVRLPAAGAERGLTASVPSAAAVYGPATIFGGIWPVDVGIAPPSGPITVSTKGTTGPGASVTSSVDIVLRSPPDPKSPGGFGPVVPTEGDELHSTCTANESGATGSVRFVKATLTTSTDESGEPKDREPIPDNPPVNYTRTGEITNVGDRWRIVFNEQIVHPDGSLTVNAIHMSLLGDIAVGEQIVGQVRCSATGADFPGTPEAGAGSAPAPSTSLPANLTGGSDDNSGSDALPWVLAGAAVVVVGALAAFLLRRRRRANAAPPSVDDRQPPSPEL